MTFGEQLRQLREAQSLGVRELSRLSGLSLSHIQYLEKDAKSPRDGTLRKLSRHLGVSFKDLVGMRDESQVETDLTLLLKEVGDSSQEARDRLFEIAEDMLKERPK